MGRTYKLFIGFLCVFLILISVSCYDAHEIDDMVHVIAIGVDKGLSDKWRLTLLFETMKGATISDSSTGSGGNENGDMYASVSVDAPSFFTGIDMLNTSASRRLAFMHTQTIIFSEELAKLGFIGEYIAPINRFKEIRRGAHVFVVKGSAMDYLKEKEPFLGVSMSKHFEQAISESYNTGFFPHTTLEQFCVGISSTYHQAIAPICAMNKSNDFTEDGNPTEDSGFIEEGEGMGSEENEFKTGGEYIAGQLPRSGKNVRENFGTAIFEGDTMVGELDGDETRYLLMVRGEFKRGFFTIQDPKKPDLIIPLDVKSSGKPKIKVIHSSTNPCVSITLGLNVDILAIQSGIGYEHQGLRDLVEEVFRQEVIDGISELIDKCRGLNTDILLFGNYAARNFFTIDEWEDYDWNSRFKKIDATVDVGVTIRRPGTQIKGYPTSE